MADQDLPTPGNGSGDSNEGPQAATLAQYIKDLSIENPNSPQVYQWQEQPRVDVQFNIDVARVSDEVHEVTIKLEVSARSDSGVQFLVELSYAGLFGLRNFPDEAMGPFCSSRLLACSSPSPDRSWPTRRRTPASRRCCSTESISAPPISPNSRRSRPNKAVAMEARARPRPTRPRSTDLAVSRAAGR